MVKDSTIWMIWRYTPMFRHTYERYYTHDINDDFLKLASSIPNGGLKPLGYQTRIDRHGNMDQRWIKHEASLKFDLNSESMEVSKSSGYPNHPVVDH
jgi:hypothetical protein